MRPIVRCPAIIKTAKVMPQTVTQADVIKKLMSASEDEIVSFVFRPVVQSIFLPDHLLRGRTIRVLKSMLTKFSPVFEAMFSADWDRNSVEMEDDVQFDQFEKFKLFLEVLLELTSLSR